MADLSFSGNKSRQMMVYNTCMYVAWQSSESAGSSVGSTSREAWMSSGHYACLPAPPHVGDVSVSVTQCYTLVSGIGNLCGPSRYYT